MPEQILRIRLANAADTLALADLGERTFRDTFAAMNAENDMLEYLADNFSARVIADQIADPASTFLLAVDESDRLYGYLKLRTGVDEPCVPGSAPIEIHRIYVDHAIIGKGVGAALMASAIENARENGFDTIWLGVWEENTRAVEFYKRWKFETVGAHEFVLGSDLQTDIIMSRPIDLED